MPDNTQMGSTTDVIATDDIGGVKVARSKVGFGVDGSYSDVSLTNPLPVLTSVAPAASELHLGQVGGSSDTVAVIPAITPGAYAAGKVVGGILTLTNAMRVSGGSGILQSAMAIDENDQKAPLDIFLFDRNPSNGTYADGGNFALHHLDRPFLLLRIAVTAADWTTVSTGVAMTNLDAISKVVKASGTANLFAVAVNRGTPTYTATDALMLRFGFLRD